jgi:hypothetical protein
MAAAFGRVLRANLCFTSFVAPVNKIFFLSCAGGDTAYITNPFATGRGGALKRCLVRGAVRAEDELREEAGGKTISGL